MATLQKIAVPITANAKKLYTSLEKSSKRLKSFAASATKTLRNVGIGLGIAAAGITAGVIAAVNKGAASLDNVIKKAQSLGVATEELRALRYAAELSGVSSANLDKSFQRMLKTIGDARNGLSTAKDALKIIGVNLSDIENLSPSEQFAAIAKALSHVSNQADKTKAAMDIFGRSGNDLTVLLGSNIQKLLDDYKQLGTGLTEQQKKAVQAYNDSKTRLSTLFDKFNEQVSAQLSGPFEFLINKITESIKKMGGLSGAAHKFAKFIVQGMNYAAKAIKGVIGLVLSLQEFMAKAKLFAISLGETVAANKQKVTENIKKALVSPISVLFGDNKSATPKPSPEGTAAANQLLAIQKQRQQFENNNTGTNKFIDSLMSGIDKAFKESSSKLTGSADSKTKNQSAGTTDTASKAIDNAGNSANKLATSAKQAADTLDKVRQSSVWQDIFGKGKTTARSAEFDKYARLAKSNIESGSAYAKSNIDTLKQIVSSAQANQGQVFTAQGTFGNVDIAGMQTVIRGLETLLNGNALAANGVDQTPTTKLNEVVNNLGGQITTFGDSVNKLAATNANQPVLGKLSFDLTTDTGRVAGEIFGYPEFLRQLTAFHQKLTNNAARAATG